MKKRKYGLKISEEACVKYNKKQLDEIGAVIAKAETLSSRLLLLALAEDQPMATAPLRMKPLGAPMSHDDRQEEADRDEDDRRRQEEEDFEEGRRKVAEENERAEAEAEAEAQN